MGDICSKKCQKRLNSALLAVRAHRNEKTVAGYLLSVLP